MQRRDNWRGRLITRIIEIHLKNPDEPLENVIEVVCLCSGVCAEMYYKDLTEFGLRRFVKEIRKEIKEEYKPCDLIPPTKGGDASSKTV